MMGGLEAPMEGPPSMTTSPSVLLVMINTLSRSTDNLYSHACVLLSFSSAWPIANQMQANQCAMSANMRMSRMSTAAPYSR